MADRTVKHETVEGKAGRQYTLVYRTEEERGKEIEKCMCLEDGIDGSVVKEDMEKTMEKLVS